MTPIPIGALDRRLALEAPSDTADGAGGLVTGWTLVAEVWANVAPSTGSERYLSDALRVQVSHRITIRSRADITPAMRLRDGARVFRISAILDRARRNRLVLLCLEEQG
ncbi:MAG: head-tail adaptor protein [Hyphomicrobiales bacterium]|nr:MAG: head-tail adaptor protein [Hyphomicrobiales bacterium]